MTAWGEIAMGQLDGKVAIVTGATSGIGERIAEMFVSEGAKVVAAGRRAEEGRKLATRCGEALSFIVTDVTNEAEVETMVNHAVSTFGKLDCLVNNAGVGSPMVGVGSLTADDFDRLFATNVRGPMLGMKYAAPIMARLGGGNIISVSSGAGIRGGASGHIYSASKAALTHLSRCVASEMGEFGVRLNTISPGAIVTGIFAKSAGLDGTAADRATGVVAELFSNLQPIKRAGITDDVAKAAVWLASDAASFVTGQDILVDGGLAPFCTLDFKAAVELRAEIGRRIKHVIEKK
jgi:NAD(P)-dependent dehydrogenase (short-subunit alcohol dehydrogenase family)